MTKETAEALKDIRMETPISDALSKAKHMEKVCINGKMERYMTVSGIEDSSMDMAYGREYRMTLI